MNKLLKTLKRLGDLPMTVDMLVETGVGKAVNSLRKHEVAGELAKSLVAKWKKLLPQSSDRPNSHDKEASWSNSYSGGPAAGGGGGDGGGGQRRKRERSPEEEPVYKDEEEEEERGYHTNYSPSPPQHQQYTPPQRGGYQSDEYKSPEAEPELVPSPPPPAPPPPRKEVRPSKPHKIPAKNHHHHNDRSKGRDEERRKRHAQPSDDHGGSEGKKRCLDTERQQSPANKLVKHSKKSTAHESKREEKKKGGDNGHLPVPKDYPTKEEDEENPNMSFEFFLTYDAPKSVKKKKKPPSSSSSTSHSRVSVSSSSQATHTRSPQPSSSLSSSSSSSKVNKPNSAQSNKRPHSSCSSSDAAPTPEKRKRVVEAVPILPEIPLPAIQPYYRPLPSIDVTPLSPLRRKVPVCNDEDDTGFTGKRLNSKMVVYSGSKTSCLPKMTSLYDQCIRVLQNNIDSIAEVGGVPFDILEPVLERCTPEQLYRIEQSNQCFTEDSDELWKRHCQRDFKSETPQEYESWREMYLRLHEEREERLRMLTQNISSAHANKPKGRQVKLAYVNSAAKPPRDIRRRQEKFGTSSGLSTAASTAAAAPIQIKPVNNSEFSGESSTSSLSSSQQSSSSSSRPSALSGGGRGGGNIGREKPQVKKIAPMMAKTIKAFKNRFSRR
ncbi:elongin-A isoform X2 [Cynoglossus semilaevis]|uniref:elongin-A isoform X2 n=1 Tax=Cynoglossus semilaevis TaxID=244447 RepID=UPI0004981421|nr:elongin-A isoform X2 [Cynoglossus semilaevis]